MKVIIIEKKVRHLGCPQCGNAKLQEITDLQPGDSFGPSFCVACGCGVVGYVSHDGEVCINELTERRTPTYVLLRLVPQNRPVYLVVRDVICEQSSEEERTEEDLFYRSYEFLYNHQLCPRIYISNAAALLREGDEDSYGLFEYVASCQAPYSDAHDEDEQQVVFRAFNGHLGLRGQSEREDNDIDLLDSAEETIG